MLETAITSNFLPFIYSPLSERTRVSPNQGIKSIKDVVPGKINVVRL
jgi:hypothetical protein